MSEPITARTIDSLSDVSCSDWNRLTESQYPFLRYEFLVGLEQQDCLGDKTGWLPQHLIFETDRQRVIAALPMYIKHNSFGEFVFDWAWADAYHQNGLPYYPKLVIAAPFTPATGPRILIDKAYRTSDFESTILEYAIKLTQERNFSSLHCLFPQHSLPTSKYKFLSRVGCQFHWRNQGYASFDDFLNCLTSKKRKQIKRERRQVHDAGIRIDRIPGGDVTDRQWRIFYQHYCSTFDQYGNFPALTAEFFDEIARTMGEQVLLVLAYHGDAIVGSSYFLIGHDTLYGRYWGCSDNHPYLHFEACYYQGIEYCIEQGLCRFEPGAQGEHKISRGFLPTKTWSWHWIQEPAFESAIERFVDREAKRMELYMMELGQHSPYKNVPRSKNLCL